MKGLSYRIAMAVIAVAALVLVFWQSEWLHSRHFAVQKLVLLCVCMVYTALIVPLIIRRLSAPVSIGVLFATVLFDVACVVIVCLKGFVFWVPVIIVCASYALLLFLILAVFSKARDNSR